MNARRFLATLTTLAALCQVTHRATPQTSSESPFMPAGGPAPTAAAAPGNQELVGMITTGKQILVGIADRTSRKSQWIPVGRTVDGVEVVSCDPKQDRAVIRVNGETKTLVLRAAPAPGAPAVTVAALPQPVPGATPSPTPSAPTTKQAEQEREARMLVSDLLEIGIQQRKAYEEAQRKAQSVKPPPAAK